MRHRARHRLKACRLKTQVIAEIGLEQPVRRYIVKLARATRDHPELPDDVKALAEPVFGHRLVPTTDARIRDRDAAEILREILRSVPVPTEFREG